MQSKNESWEAEVSDSKLLKNSNGNWKFRPSTGTRKEEAEKSVTVNQAEYFMMQT